MMNVIQLQNRLLRFIPVSIFSLGAFVVQLHFIPLPLESGFIPFLQPMSISDKGSYRGYEGIDALLFL